MKETIQCRQCGTWIRVGQIHSAHGTNLTQITVDEKLDLDDWGRPMFGISAGDVVPDWMRGKVCPPEFFAPEEELWFKEVPSGELA